MLTASSHNYVPSQLCIRYTQLYMAWLHEHCQHHFILPLWGSDRVEPCCEANGRLQLLSTHYWICSRSVLTVRFDSKLLSCSSVLETEVLLPSFLRGFGLGRVELLYSCECKGVYAGEGGNFKHRQFCFEHQLSIQAKHLVGRWSAFQKHYSEVSKYGITWSQ